MLWHAIERDLQGRVKGSEGLGPLVRKDAQELGTGLYNSGWEYLEQLEAYRMALRPSGRWLRISIGRENPKQPKKLVIRS